MSRCESDLQPGRICRYTSSCVGPLGIPGDKRDRGFSFVHRRHFLHVLLSAAYASPTCDDTKAVFSENIECQTDHVSKVKTMTSSEVGVQRCRFRSVRHNPEVVPGGLLSQATEPGWLPSFNAGNNSAANHSPIANRVPSYVVAVCHHLIADCFADLNIRKKMVDMRPVSVSSNASEVQRRQTQLNSIAD